MTQEQIAQCPQCERTYQETDRFCQICAVQLQLVVPSTAPVAPQPHSQVLASEPLANSAVQVRWNTQAILGFVFLLVGITVAAIPFAHVALAKLKTTGERGRPLAIVTLVLAYPLFALVMTVFITSIVIAATGGAG